MALDEEYEQLHGDALESNGSSGAAEFVGNDVQLKVAELEFRGIRDLENFYCLIVHPKEA